MIIEIDDIVKWLGDNKAWFWKSAIAFCALAFGIWKYIYPRLKSPSTANLSDEARVRKAMKGTSILFVDDDTSFKVVDILKAAGWTNTSIQEDINSLDETALVSADIVFFDIQGVGRKLGFKDDGLGLTAAVKERHPSKYVIVYSSETRGNRFHKGLNAADEFLAKNAEPYEFQKIVEDFVLRRT